MPVSVEWLDARQSILLYRFVAPWRWDEAFSAFQQGSALIAQAAVPVWEVMGLTASGPLPADSFVHVARALQHGMLWGESVVVVGASRFVHLITDHVLRLHRIRLKPGYLHWTDSLDEAVFLIEALRAHQHKGAPPDHP